MSQQFSTGATHIFIAVGGASASTALYLGTTETIIGIDQKPSWDAVMNDMSGAIEPLDFAFEGAGMAMVSTVLTKFNMTSLNFLDTLPGPLSTNAPGAMTLNDMGALAAIEGFAFQLWLVYQFGGALASKAAAYPGQEPGIWFPQVILWQQRPETGTRARKEQRIFQAWKKFVATGTTNPQFVLYSKSNAVAGFSSLPLTAIGLGTGT